MSATLPDELVEPRPADERRGGGWRPAARTLARWAAGNRTFTVALLLGATLRVLVAVAYAPALEFFGDSYNYLQEAARVPSVDVWHPIGYPVVVRLVSVTHSLAVLTALQHVAGLVTAVLLYRLVRRFGAGGVTGTAATLPVLLDAYQVDVEQFVLSEAMFTLLLVVTLWACVRVTRRPTTGAAVGVGLLLAGVTLTRTVGVFLVVVVVAYLLLSRAGWWRTVAVVVAFAVPVGAYALAFRATYGVTGLQAYSGRYLYGTVAPYVDCRHLRLPAEERRLCPTLPTYARPGFNQYVWDPSPYRDLTGDAFHRSAVAGRFAHAAMRHQPLATASVVAHNFAHYFEPGRPTSPRDWFVGSWQFPLRARSPAWHIEPAYFGYGAKPGGAHGQIVAGLAGPLRSYQHVGFTPGPLLLLCLVLVVAAAPMLRRDRPARLVAGLLGASGTLLLLAPAVSAGFDWRYLVPAQALIVPAGVVAGGVLARRLPRLARVRLLPVGATLAALAAVASNLATPSVYAADRLRPSHIGAAPATLPVGAGLTVHVGRPDVLETACVTSPGGSRWRALVAFPTRATYKSGERSLVQQSNFAVAGYDATDGPLVPNRDSRVLPDVLLGPRHRRAHGDVFVYLSSTAGRLDYVDPRGGGAAAWTFRVHEGDFAGRLGHPCTKPTTWAAGERIRTLRLSRLAPFTELSDQRVDYALTWDPQRAANFDLRWRAGSAQARFGPWQYPPAWQHTTATSQTLVNLAPGFTYCFAVRAHDRRNVATAWSLPRCTARMTDDTAVAATRDWQRFGGKHGFYAETYSEATAAGAAMSLAGRYTRIGLVGYRCPSCGVVRIYSGDRVVRTLDLASPDPGLFAWISPPFEPRVGPVTLRVVSAGKPVVIDAFGLQR